MALPGQHFLRNLVERRTLLFQLVRRDFEQRFIGSAAGWVWGVIHPLVLLVSWVFVFEWCLHTTLPPNEVTQNYSLFLFCGFQRKCSTHEGSSCRMLQGGPMRSKSFCSVSLLVGFLLLAGPFLRSLFWPLPSRCSRIGLRHNFRHLASMAWSPTLVAQPYPAREFC